MWNYLWKYDLTLMVSAKKGNPHRKPAFTFLCEIYINVLLIPASAYKLSCTIKEAICTTVVVLISHNTNMVAAITCVLAF